MAQPWTEEQELWVMKHAGDYSPLRLTHEFNQQFPETKRTLDAIRYKLKQLSVKAVHAEIAQSAILHVDEWRALSKEAYPYPAEKPKRAPNKKRPYKQYLIWPDTHVPNEDKPSVRAVLSMMNDVAFDGLIIIGDFLDMASISHWNKAKRLTSEGLRLKQQYAQGNALLDEICKRLPKGADMRWLDGNHEDWYYQLIEENPTLEGLLDPHDELHLRDRGFTEIRRYGHDQFTRLGKLWLMHGIYTTRYHAKKHLDEIKHNVMYGHLHDIQVYSSASVARELAFQAYCIGCLANVEPEYMRGRPNNWSHGFGVVCVFPDGKFQADVIRIINGRFIYNGTLYQG
jgi:predicted phosphodiesterase